MTSTPADRVAVAPTVPMSAPQASMAYQRYAVGLLLAIYILNFFDRQVINILAEPIRHDLHLADWQIGMMTGIAFAMLNVAFSLPLARLADRHDRPYILGGAVAVWSAFTAVCGTARGFGSLLLARMGVGAGESACTPIAHSLICDYTPRERRAAALSIYHMGVPIGSLFGMAIGGVLSDAYGWRHAFFIAGAPGILFALLAVFTLREPRRQLARQVEAATERASFGEALRYLAGKRSYWFVSLGAALKAFIAYGHAVFVAAFFLRTHGPGLAALGEPLHLKAAGFLGLALGLVNGICGVVGIWLGGKIADRAAARDLRAYCRIPAFALLAALPFQVAAYWVDSVPVALALIAVSAVIGSLWYGPVHTVETSVVPPHMRATSSAIVTLQINLIGLGLGPLFIGLLSDLFQSGLGVGKGEGAQLALTASAFLALPAFALFWTAQRTMAKDVES